MTGHHDRETGPLKRPKIQLPPLPSRQQNVSLGKVRKKTLEACQKCREKRIKCNGVWPCESCSNKGYKCSLRTAMTDDHAHLTEIMGQVLDRLRRVEDIIQHHARDPPAERREGWRSLLADKRTVPSVTEFNRQTGGFEYYGETSNFVVASSLGKRLNRLFEDDRPSSSFSQKQPRQSSHRQERASSIEVPGLQTWIDTYDYVMPLNMPIRRYRRLQQDVADRHLNNFFATIHIYFPIFDISSFRARYARLRELFGSNLLYTSAGESQGQQQSLCLLYAVLALGALYAADEDSSSWAAWYFSEAQELLGRLFDAVNLQLVQAGMFMVGIICGNRGIELTWDQGAYAQHALKPNLAYNLAGAATRMAFSIGLNLDPKLASHDWDAEEGRRTWWMIFIQEVELSLDSGRPMSIRKGDISVDYPNGKMAQSEESPQYQMSDFIKHLAGVAQITRDILKFVATSGSSIGTDPSWEAKSDLFSNMLIQWRADLPTQLEFEAVCLDMDLGMPNSWISRQRSSLLVHYNLALIVLHRFSLIKPDISRDEELINKSQAVCIKAAGHVISHIHGLFQVAPNLRRWRYYCYYCLQATLVLLFKVIDEPYAEQTKEIVAKCHLSVAVFKQIDLKVAERCADVVVRALSSRQKQEGHGESPGKSSSKSGQPAPPTLETAVPIERPRQNSDQSPAKDPQHDLFENGPDGFAAESYSDLTFSGTECDFLVDDESWNDFVESGKHVRPFESWMNILYDQDGQ